MGRSQVKYNKTHGRPGTKGRGRGGGGRTSTKQHSRAAAQLPQGDNAWRYETTTTHSSLEPEVDLEMLDLETHKLPQYSETKEEGDHSDGFLLVGGAIDLSKMGKALDKLSVAERLGIPSYLTTELEVRDTSRKEINDLSAASVHKQGDVLSSTSPVDDEERKQEVLAGDEDDSKRGDDDLDAWLDSVIE